MLMVTPALPTYILYTQILPQHTRSTTHTFEYSLKVALNCAKLRAANITLNLEWTVLENETTCISAPIYEKLQYIFHSAQKPVSLTLGNVKFRNNFRGTSLYALKCFFKNLIWINTNISF